MNNPLHSLPNKIKNFVDTFLIPILRAIIGKWDWQPPQWLEKILSPFSRLYIFARQKVTSFKAKSPKRFYLALLLLVAALFGGYKGFIWYVNRPQPHLITFSLNNPQATSSYPDKKIRPLIIKFSGSAAPLELIGKDVKTNFSLTPPLSSTLKWISDSELQLFPTSDWEVGKRYEIKFNRSFFASHILLENYNLEFITPEFKTTITKSSFYEDPVNPKIKKAVATVSFTYPINKSIFEKSIGIKMRMEPIKNFDDPEVKNLGFKVTYDDQDLKAYIHSDQIDIPENTGEVLLTIAKGIPSALGGPATVEDLKKTIRIPGIEDYFRINEVNDSINTNEKDEPEHVATLKASTMLKTNELAKKIKVYQLPKDKPAMGTELEQKNYYWNDPLEVTATVLSKAKRVDIDLIPTELEYSAEQSFKFIADNNSYLYVLVEKGLPSFGDYKLSKDYQAIVQVDDFPRMLKIMSEGGLLSLSGEKKLSIISRYIPEVKIEINRLLPSTVNHLLAVTSGNFQTPEFNTKYNGFDVENIAEKFVEIKKMSDFESGKNQYSLLDFQSFIKKDAPPRGLFYVKLSPNKKEEAPEKKKVVTVDDENSESEFSEQTSADYYQEGEDEIIDQRLVLITDLGILVKDSADGIHDVFVMSLKEGKPVPGAKVDLIGKNGLSVLSANTTEDGKVSFPNTTDFKNERTPLAYIVQKDDDFSFLPYNRNDRKLNLSRFDTGGIFNKGRNDAIQAFAFNDRGIYRPGDTINLGFVVKQLNWEALPDGLPLELSVTNPKGSEVQNETIRFSPSGFKEFHFKTYDNSITGRYNFSLYIQNDGKRGAFLASTSAKVEEFQPDRMKVKSNLSITSNKGWISPANVKALVNAQNLFGTAAAGSTVRAEMKLNPGYNYFNEYPDYHFYTPNIDRQSYDQKLGEKQSDQNGNVEFDLGLNNFVKNLYNLTFSAEVFEEGSGRSVSTATSALVSDKAFIIGYKSDGDLGYITKDSSRKLNLIALNSTLDKIALNKVKLELVEKKYVSTLIKQKDGTFAYESTLEENSLSSKELTLSPDGLDFTLETKTPGSFLLLVRNEQGEVENEIAYNVTGEANVSTNLEKKAELEVLSNKKEYAPLEEIELNIKVPYSGSGLITIERDKVYTYKWFSTNSTSSIQTIQVPAELEGNGYVTVNFVRSLDSKEIFMSPLSYSSIPFNISREKRTEKIELKVPEIIKPGEMLKIAYKTEHPADLIIFAVDEGILQFGKYKTPDPLSHFYRKRALEVKTSQILDLLLPEYSILKELSAAGGDEGVTLSKHLNPFKRKNQKPVVYWSGIISSTGEAGEIQYQVPEYFNGSIKVMAVAVSPGTIGINEKTTKVKADFIIQANAPYFVTPGDEFELGALIANNLQGSGSNAKVNFKVEVCPQLEVIGSDNQDLEITENTDKAANFKVKAKQLGVCAIRFITKSKENIATNSLEMSIRPAQPLMTTFTTKYAQKGWLSGNSEEIIPQRKMYSELRNVEASASTLPISLAKGFVNYLKSYPHGCSEQIVTQALPGVILGVRPELGLAVADVKPKVDYAIKTLQGRQNSEGGFGLWSNGALTSDFINVYAVHFLTEAREQGYDIPSGVLQNALEYLKTFVAQKSSSASVLRAQAYALYILSRNGILTTNWLSSVREQLETQNIKDWKKELTGLYLAATYKLLKLDSDAGKIVKYVDPNFVIETDYQNYFDSTVLKANYFYIISKHFPEIAKGFGAEEILGLVKNISEGEPSTIDIGYTMLALNEYAKITGKAEEKGIKIAEVLADNKVNNFILDNSLFPTAKISPDALKVTFEGISKAPLFYQLSETGFDLSPPTTSTKSKIELIHELKDAKGNTVTEMKMEDKLYVHLLVRSLDQSMPNVAVIDLLPGGFELDLSDDTLGSRTSAVNSGDTWIPDFIDAREDRLLFYGYLDSSAKRFVYRIKPINKGKYQVPPAYGEGMYNREVKGYSKAGSIEVK